MKTVLNIKIDSALKKKVQKTAKEMGLPVSLVFTNYAHKFVEEREITFRGPEIPNKKTAKILKEIEYDSKMGRNFSPIFENAEDAVAYLRAQK